MANGKKIVVIDDSSTICKTASVFLSKEGYEVITVENGFDALSVIIKENPALVFIDVLMPRLDGLQTCQIIKQNSRFKDLHIIFLSSKDSYFDKAKGLLLGASDYLTKPFKRDDIVEIAKKYLG